MSTRLEQQFNSVHDCFMEFETPLPGYKVYHARKALAGLRELYESQTYDRAEVEAARGKPMTADLLRKKGDEFFSAEKKLQDLLDLFPYCLLFLLPVFIAIAPAEAAHEFQVHR